MKRRPQSTPRERGELELQAYLEQVELDADTLDKLAQYVKRELEPIEADEED